MCGAASAAAEGVHRQLAGLVPEYMPSLLCCCIMLKPLAKKHARKLLCQPCTANQKNCIQAGHLIAAAVSSGTSICCNTDLTSAALLINRMLLHVLP
jgi:hypothetical protein